MRNILKQGLIALFLLTGLYGCLSIVELSINIMNWSLVSRLAYGGVCFYLIVWISLNMEEKC